MALDVGTTLGSYQVAAKIGEGGMGQVYRARDAKFDREVARLRDFANRSNVCED